MRFIEITTRKIRKYEGQIASSQNENFQRFRREEIGDLAYSIDSMSQFFTEGVEASIGVLYKKEKKCIVKNKNYLEALKVIREIEAREHLTKGDHRLPLQESFKQAEKRAMQYQEPIKA